MADIVMLVAFEAAALLFVGLGIPLWRRKVRPNALYGFRTPATLKDERVWYDVNERAGADMMGTGAVLALLAPALHAAGVSEDAMALGCIAWLSVAGLFMLVHGALRIRELVRGR